MKIFDLRFRNLALAGLLCAFTAAPAVAASAAPSFKTYDSNDDGTISLDEYVAQGGNEQAFQESDANKDKHLSVDEFIKAGAGKDSQSKSGY